MVSQSAAQLEIHAPCALRSPPHPASGCCASMLVPRALSVELAAAPCAQSWQHRVDPIEQPTAMAFVGHAKLKLQ